MYAYSYGQAKTIRKRYRVGGSIFGNGEKYLRFQTKTDTCGQDLTLNLMLLVTMKSHLRVCYLVIATILQVTLYHVFWYKILTSKFNIKYK